MDPSSTVSYECNRTDHGHGRTNGAYAAYRGRLEIIRYLLERFPNLLGSNVTLRFITRERIQGLKIFFPADTSTSSSRGLWSAQTCGVHWQLRE